MKTVFQKSAKTAEQCHLQNFDEIFYFITSIFYSIWPLKIQTRDFTIFHSFCPFFNSAAATQNQFHQKENSALQGGYWRGEVKGSQMTRDASVGLTRAERDSIARRKGPELQAQRRPKMRRRRTSALAKLCARHQRRDLYSSRKKRHEKGGRQMVGTCEDNKFTLSYAQPYVNQRTLRLTRALYAALARDHQLDKEETR